MRSRHRLVVFAAALALLVPAAARAQRNVAVERFVPTLDGDGFLGIQGTRTPGPWRYNLALWLDYTSDPLIVRGSDDSEQSVISDRLTTDLVVQLGIGGRFGVALDAPIVAWQSTDPAPLGESRAISSVAFADPRLSVRYRFYGEDSTVERERNEGPGVAVLAAGTLPIGQTDAFAGEGSVRTDLEVIGDFHVLGAGAVTMLGWRHRFDTRDLLGVTFRDELSFGIALALPIPLFHARDFAGLLEVRGATDAGAPFASQATTAVEGDLGFRVAIDDLTFTGAIGTGLNGGVGSPAVRSVIGMSWAPRVHDMDQDRIVDSRDECPPLPEDVDGFQDADGCPDPDNDNDLVPDPDDRCPLQTAEEGRDEDEDGCTDPIGDADSDGVPDASDSCPSEAEDPDGVQDADGCVDPDNDSDDVPDTADRCAAEPEDRDGWQDADGCPDPDDDGDGVGDAEDRCARVAEDRDAFEDDDGCPDPDNDHDGVLDVADRCGAQPETINGVEDGDGCPDRGGRALWRVDPATQRLTGAVTFDANHRIAPTSTGAIDQLALLLVARAPDVWRVAISTGDAARVTALRVALAQRGVAPNRIEVAIDASIRGTRVIATRVARRETPPASARP